MTKTVKVWLNRQETPEGRLAIFDRFGPGVSRYEKGDAMEMVYETSWTPTVEVMEILDGMFEQTNRGAPGFLGDDLYPHRSLSCGDVIEVDGMGWVCEPVGWKLTPWNPGKED